MSVVVATLMHEGKRYLVHTEYTDPEPENVLWHWTEGNYGCDCNRKLFIADEYGNSFPEQPNENGWFPCGTTVTLTSLLLDGKELMVDERLTAIGLISP